jgi:hypothetical protein
MHTLTEWAIMVLGNNQLYLEFYQEKNSNVGYKEMAKRNYSRELLMAIISIYNNFFL